MSMPAIDEPKNITDNSTADSQPIIFSDEAVETMQEFGAVLQRIHNRLFAEGKIVEVDTHYAPRDNQ